MGGECLERVCRCERGGWGGCEAVGKVEGEGRGTSEERVFGELGVREEGGRSGSWWTMTFSLVLSRSASLRIAWRTGIDKLHGFGLSRTI